NCDLSDADLSQRVFLDCEFNSCNLSGSNFVKTGLKNIKFRECKLLGLHFENCDPFLFAVDFDKCLLSLSSFYKIKLKKTRFKDSNLSEVDFTEADLTSSLFDNCDLAGAKFERTILEKADLRTAHNYSIDPELNKIKKARFSRAGITGLLDKYDIDIE
ncbi:MAG TPA: pentapeptide repeat-containing protein, partial [Chitinophagaceae bacterium]